jgi:hypothetical protein
MLAEPRAMLAEPRARHGRLEAVAGALLGKPPFQNTPALVGGRIFATDGSPVTIWTAQ